MLDPEHNVVGSFSNSFPLLAKPSDECFTQLMNERLGVSLCFIVDDELGIRYLSTLKFFWISLRKVLGPSTSSSTI